MIRFIRSDVYSRTSDYLVWIVTPNLFAELGALSTNGIIAEVKKLYDQAYQLGVQESKEMTRGKYLNIFTSNRKKS